MRKLIFTKELVENYYEHYFYGDLRRYFPVENIDGVDYIIRVECPGKNYLADRNMLKRCREKLPDGTIEEEFLFIALVSSLFVAQSQMLNEVGENDLAAFMKDLGFPLIQSWLYLDSVDGFWDRSDVNMQLNREEAYMALGSAVDVVAPFMKEKLASHLSIWQGGKLNKWQCLVKEIEKPIMEAIQANLVKLKDENEQWKRFGWSPFSCMRGRNPRNQPAAAAEAVAAAKAAYEKANQQNNRNVDLDIN